MAAFDFSELDKLAADLESAPAELPTFLSKAIEVTARKVKDAARGKVSGRRHFARAAQAIGYDLTGTSGDVSSMDAEIGYNKYWRAGRLGNLIEFGAPGSNNRLAPGGELQDALRQNQGDFETGVAKALDDALKASGL